MLSPEEVVQSLQSQTVPKPPNIPFIGLVPLTYHGKFEEEHFEFGRNSRGRKDHPPTAYGIISSNKQNPSETLVEVSIRPNNFTLVIAIFTILVIFSLLPSVFFILSQNYEALIPIAFLPIFFIFGFLANYFIFIGYNNKLAKDIQRFINGKVVR